MVPNFMLQSAMEYLMTYGWAILIIAIVLAALFLLGVFNSPLGSHCITPEPFSCSSTPPPALATNGSLTITLGQATGGPIYFGGAACSSQPNPSGLPLYGNSNVYGNNALTALGFNGIPQGGSSTYTVYNSFEAPIASGATFTIVMTCYSSTPGTSGNGKTQFPLAGGVPFTGAIWLNYSTTSASGPWSTAPITTTFSVKPSRVSSTGAR